MGIITPWPPQRGAELEHVDNWDLGTVERVHGGVGGDRVVTSIGLTLHRETYGQTWRVSGYGGDEAGRGA